MPNQGLPEVVDGETRYPLTPDAFASAMQSIVETFGVSVIGGCCGTTPEHIRRLIAAIPDAATHGGTGV